MFVARLYSTLIGGAVGRTYPHLPLRVFRWGLARMFADPAKCSLEMAREYQRSIRPNGHIRGILQTVKSYGNDMDLLCSQVPVLSEFPIRLIWGERDPVVPLRSATELMRGFHDARLRVLPGVGHLPYEEGPQEFALAVNESLAD